MNRTTKALFICALVSLLSTPAHAVTWSGEDGWEVQYTGFVNLFYNQLDFDYQSGASESSSLLNEGLLPSFHTMKAKSPTVNGLTGTSQITFAIDTSTDKAVNLNKSNGDSLIDLREVFFNVEGGFGTLSVGRTLALYQRQAILKDMTLFGVGAMADPDSNGTALGRIGIGYVYPDFRARFAWISPMTNGFQANLGVFQPRESFKGTSIHPNSQGTEGGRSTLEAPASSIETDVPMFQGEFTWSGNMGGGIDLGLWAGFVWQTAEIRLGESTVSAPRRNADGQLVGADNTVLQDADGDPATRVADVADAMRDDVVLDTAAGTAPAATEDVSISGWNLGLDMTVGQFNLVGSYYDGSGIGTLFLGGGLSPAGGRSSVTCAPTGVTTRGAPSVVAADGTVTTGGNVFSRACAESDSNGGYIQGTYTIPGAGDSKTKVGLSWGYSKQDQESGAPSFPRVANEGYTVGVYHDINSWLKVIAEYNDYELESLTREVSGFSVGAFMFW